MQVIKFLGEERPPSTSYNYTIDILNCYEYAFLQSRLLEIATTEEEINFEIVKLSLLKLKKKFSLQRKRAAGNKDLESMVEQGKMPEGGLPEIQQLVVSEFAVLKEFSPDKLALECILI